MSRTSIIAILATAGVVFTGEANAEAATFARVVQSGDPSMLERFAKQNPQSQFATTAIQIAANCTTNWVGGSCGEPSVLPEGSREKPTLKYSNSG